jgi:hypothetical protein
MLSKFRLVKKLARPALFFASMLAAAGGLPGQAPAGATPKANPEPATLKITFLPPPLEGTLSLGVYDRSGKKVRTLAVESAAAQFTVGLNGLITSWDGRDDSGNLQAPGKYSVKGLAVGDLEITGEAYHANDWVAAEDSPRPVAFHGIRYERGVLELQASDLEGQFWSVKESVAVPDDMPVFEKSSAPAAPPKSCPGKAGSRWSIEKSLGDSVVVQFDAQGEIMRRLSIGAGQPVPIGIAASTDSDEVFLLEQDGERWRVRGLRRKQAEKPAASGPVWETFFEKNRWPCGRFADAAARVGRPHPFAAEASINVQSQANPLLADGVVDVGLSVGMDGDGSFLQTADGLLLRRLTDTGKLRWAVVGRDPRQPGVVLLQSAGAVVEEYRILQPGMLMTFNAGEYQWPPK